MSKHFGSLEISELLKIKGGSPSVGDLLKIVSVDSDGYAEVSFESSSNYLQNLESVLTEQNGTTASINVDFDLEINNADFELNVQNIVSITGGYGGNGNSLISLEYDNTANSSQLKISSNLNNAIIGKKKVTGGQDLYWEIDSEAGLVYKNDFSTVGTAEHGDRWVPDWGAVRKNSVQVKKLNLTFNQPGSTAIGTQVPANSKISRVIIEKVTVFNGSPKLDIGISGNTDIIMNDTENDLTNSNIDIDAFSGYTNASAFTMLADLDAGGATQGEINIYVEFYTE
jgi:hypothetical protein